MTDARRPLKVRGLKVTKTIASGLSKTGVTPNQISIASIFFAALASLSLLWIPIANAWLQVTLLLLAAVFIQCRLLCNLFDGMVAVEGSKGTISGELFNDIPDRIADPLILVAAGYACAEFDHAILLGWLSGILAVFTAYIRTLAASIGAPVDFVGPMAKQQRMAVITIALIASGVGYTFNLGTLPIYVGLIVIVIGSVITVIRRTVRAYRALES
ncbi:MAG: CDP-alcohol phosphatidyltransferase family protein [Proteobacteria bacterium]|nr:CDP-alcohol phosphatidyltransferase family protein [Pseudomonadota bacterium]